MPFVRLTLNDSSLAAHTQQKLATSMTKLIEQDFGKNPEITVVQINLVPTESWFIGCEPVTGTGGHMEVSLSTGINTDAEKATFIHDAYRELEEILGTLAQIFYIEVHEIPGKSWGYNGLPQADRSLDAD